MIYARVPRDVASPCKTASTLRSPQRCHSASDRLAGAFITAHTRTHPTEFTIPANDAPHRTLRDHKQRYLIALPSATCSTMLALPKQHTASVLHSTIHCLPITLSATRHICAPLASGSPFALRPAAASTPFVVRDHVVYARTAVCSAISTHPYGPACATREELGGQYPLQLHHTDILQSSVQSVTRYGAAQDTQ